MNVITTTRDLDESSQQKIEKGAELGGKVAGTFGERAEGLGATVGATVAVVYDTAKN